MKDLIQQLAAREDSSAAAAGRLLGDAYPVFRRWIADEQRRKTPVSALLVGLCIASPYFVALLVRTQAQTETEPEEEVYVRIDRLMAVWRTRITALVHGRDPLISGEIK